MYGDEEQLLVGQASIGVVFDTIRADSDLLCVRQRTCDVVPGKHQVIPDILHTIPVPAAAGCYAQRLFSCAQRRRYPMLPCTACRLT